MKDQLEKRINELKVELQEGQKVLEELDMKRATLAQTILRISGAIQVLDEINTQEEITNS